ncbi:MAG: PLP-dependent aminotransferase family protein [Ruminococcaceae bacterium]|nr:PLP-dependent aminotransferase family protein [Oscillospiraceae bacterium]
MKYKIDTKAKEKAYIQLYRQLRQDITDGIYKYGSKLPSKRLLAEESGVSVITVEHCYSLLCDEGYTEARERSGYFVIYREKDFLALNEKSDSTLKVKHSLHPTASDFPFSVLSKTMRRVLSAYGEDILVKSPNFGCDELRRAIADYLSRNTGIITKPECIIIGSGAEYLYSLIVMLLGREKIFALENPSYEKIRKVYSACQVDCRMLEMGKDGIKTSELKKTDADVLHITPFNSYPSGVTATASKRMEYLAWGKERQAVIIEDNYDSELTVSTKHEDTVFSLDRDGCVIYLNTFSRTVAPSMRVGYMILPEKMMRDFEERLGFYSCTVPVFEQYVLAELIEKGDFERHINRTRRMRRKK